MDWTRILVLGLFVVACILAIYQSRKENWALNQKIGTVVFLIGATIGLFLDDFVTANSEVRPWVEPIGAGIMVTGLLVAWLWEPD